MQKYWKVLLTTRTPLGDCEFRACEIAERMDDAIRTVRGDAGPAFQKGSAAAQVLSDLEMTDPLRAERIFNESGDFNAYLREMA